MKRITEIEITKSETVIISQPRQHLRLLCRQCDTASARMIKPDDAASILGISLRAIFRLIESNAVHFEETANGAIYVCHRSLSAETLNTLPINFE